MRRRKPSVISVTNLMSHWNLSKNRMCVFHEMAKMALSRSKTITFCTHFSKGILILFHSPWKWTLHSKRRFYVSIFAHEKVCRSVDNVPSLQHTFFDWIDRQLSFFALYVQSHKKFNYAAISSFETLNYFQWSLSFTKAQWEIISQKYN